MNKLLLSLCLCLLLAACETAPTDNGTPTTPPPTASQPSATQRASLPADTTSVKTTDKTGTPQSTANDAPINYPTTHDCQVTSGTAMEDNELFIPSERLWVTIVADKTSKDMDFGDSYRIFDVYNTVDCKRADRIVLPVNNSPDFPWYIMPATYENNNQVICTQGFEFTYCYDVKARKMLPQMAPQYLRKRESVDAQSGMPLGLAVHDHYLFGYAQDMGTFAYDLKNKADLQPILAAAEYRDHSRNQYHSLFLLPQGKGTYQIVIPIMDMDNGILNVQPLLENPVKLNPKIAKNVQDNRYQVLKNMDTEERLAFDLKQDKMVALPSEVAKAATGKVLEYLKMSQN